MVRKKKPKAGPGTAPSDSSGAPMVPNGLPHGGRQALEGMNSGTSSARSDGAATAASSSLGPIPMGGVLGPSARPNEPVTAGIDSGPGHGAPPRVTSYDDPDVLLREVARAYPHPDILRLLSRRG